VAENRLQLERDAIIAKREAERVAADAVSAGYAADKQVAAAQQARAEAIRAVERSNAALNVRNECRRTVDTYGGPAALARAEDELEKCRYGAEVAETEARKQEAAAIVAQAEARKLYDEAKRLAEEAERLWREAHRDPGS
jgi:translation initiation factor IF-2